MYIDIPLPTSVAFGVTVSLYIPPLLTPVITGESLSSISSFTIYIVEALYAPYTALFGAYKETAIVFVGFTISLFTIPTVTIFCS